MASGAMTWPAAVVITTKPLRRLLESSMYTLNHAPGVVGGGFAFPARATGGAAAAAPPLQPRAARRSSGAWPRDNLVSIAQHEVEPRRPRSFAARRRNLAGDNWGTLSTGWTFSSRRQGHGRKFGEVVVERLCRACASSQASKGKEQPP
eukprot:scaffold15316_cov69-Phaeocystis_antarctica.AAC.2